MPAWTANWADVAFDHAAAEAAAQACERAARVLREAATTRRATAVAAGIDGTGPWRDHFDQKVMMLAQRTDAVEARLRSTAALLRDAAQRAGLDQAARVNGREQWQLEANAELAAAAAASAVAGSAPPIGG